MPAVKRALIADDHSLYREGLSLLLKDQFSIRKVMEASNFNEAVTCMDKAPGIELALFDLSMPGMGGPSSLAPLRARHPFAKIAIVAASESKADVLAAIASGLNGFIPKSLTNSDFVAALTTILNGHIYVPVLMMARESELLRVLQGASPNRRPSHAATKEISVLTARQKEVLDCVRTGMSNRDISEKLGISIGTVKAHVSSILILLNVRNRIQLASN